LDYPKWADQLRLQIRENAECIAKEDDIEIEFFKVINSKRTCATSITEPRLWTWIDSYYFMYGIVRQLFALTW